MRIIKKINNNFALAQDDKGRILIAYGKGVGFPEMPYELEDLSKIDRTFYDVKDEHIPLIREADEQIATLSMQLLDFIRVKVNKDISDYLYFVLVDHIDFAIKRHEKGLYVPMQLGREIRYNYQDEYNAAFRCWQFINKKMGIHLPKDEVSIIAMHIVESEEIPVKKKSESDIEQILEHVTQMLQDEFSTRFDPADFNLYRFQTHLRYLIERIQKGDHNNGNEEMYKMVSEQYPKIDQLAEKIAAHLRKQLHADVNESEKLYLILHIERLSKTQNK